MAFEDPEAELPPLDPRSARLLAAAAENRPLPPFLRQRLLDLPTRAEAEDALERRFERARSEGLAAAAANREPVWPAELPPPLARTERAIARWIAAARRRAPLPVGLERRLWTLGRGARKPLPAWLVDVRWAAAAGLLLTLLSTMLVDDASALYSEKASEARTAREELQVRFSEAVYSGGEDTLAFVLRYWNLGFEATRSRVEELRDLYEEKLRKIQQSEPLSRFVGQGSTRGVNDGPQS